MGRESFGYLGIAMFMLMLLQAEDFFGRAASGRLDFGRLFSTRFTMLTAGMLLTWFCFRVS